MTNLVASFQMLLNSMLECALFRRVGGKKTGGLGLR